MKTNIRLFLAVFISLLVFSTVTAQDVVTLRMTSIGGGTGEALQMLIEQWNANNPNLQVNLEIQPDNIAYWQNSPTTLFAADDRPDLAWWWCAGNTQWPDMYRVDRLADLSDLYESEGWLDAFPQATLDFYLAADGNRYGVNIDQIAVPYVFYNKDIFAEVGIEVPQTWDELYAAADALRAAGYQPLAGQYSLINGGHTMVGLMTRTWTSEQYQAFMLNWSPDAPEWSLEYKWTEPYGVRIFEIFRDMAERGLLVDGFAGLNDANEARSLFTSGRAAMWQNGSWEAAESGLASVADFDWDYFYYPAVGGQEPAAIVGSYISDCFIVFNGPNEAAAKQVLSFIMQRENVEQWVDVVGSPAGRSDIPEAVYAESMTEMSRRMIGDGIEGGAPSMWHAYVPADLADTLVQVTDFVLNGQMTPEEAAQMMQDATEEAREG